MQIYLAVTPDHLDTALRCTGHIAHVAYRIGGDGLLTRSALPPNVKGGVMVLNDGEECVQIDTSELCAAVWQECAARGFGAVVADFEQPPTDENCAFLNALCKVLRKNGRRLLVPEPYGCEVRHAAVLICTAVSGGTLRRRLEEARERFGDRVALDMQRVRMEFPLPCPEGEGCALGRSELEQLLCEKPAVFFSEDLCAKYFVRVSCNEPRFVLFDDAQTLRRKLRVAQEMGIGTAFVMYPEVDDILEDLWRKDPR